jgi:hypothetical protein
MKRISVPIQHMEMALESMGVKPDLVNDIIGSFDVIDAGKYNELVMSEVPFSGYTSEFTMAEILTTMAAFWQCVLIRAETGSNQEIQATGAIRAVYFMSLNLGIGGLVACISVWWEKTAEIHGSTALECWA